MTSSAVPSLTTFYWHSFHPPMVATSAGLAPLRRSGLTLLLSRVGSMRLWFFIFSRGGSPWHLPLRYHPPVIFTLHLKFIFHMKFVGPVDVRSLSHRQGRVILSPPFLSEFRLIKNSTSTYIMTWYYDVISRYYPYNFLLALLSPTHGRYLRWARSAAPFRLNAPFK